MSHRWTHGTPLVRHATDERIEQGDLFEPSEHELRSFGDRIEAVDGVDEWHDWNEESWLDLGYEQRADDVHKGRVDEHLAAIADVETSQTVTDAVDERRAELEG